MIKRIVAICIFGFVISGCTEDSDSKRREISMKVDGQLREYEVVGIDHSGEHDYVLVCVEKEAADAEFTLMLSGDFASSGASINYWVRNGDAEQLYVGGDAMDFEFADNNVELLSGSFSGTMESPMVPLSAVTVTNGSVYVEF